MSPFFSRFRAVLFMLAVTSVGGCSFQSTQYEFVKSLVSKKEESGPRKNWVIEWNGLRTAVYAVNAPGYVLFADEFGAQIKFQSGQITLAKGLFSSEPFKEITATIAQQEERITLTYRFGGGLAVEIHKCGRWQQLGGNVDRAPKGYLWEQDCVYNEVAYKNSKWLNELGQLSGLELRLRHEFPMLNVFRL